MARWFKRKREDDPSGCADGADTEAQQLEQPESETAEMNEAGSSEADADSSSSFFSNSSLPPNKSIKPEISCGT